MLVSKRLKAKSVLVVFLSMTACSQNASVTHPAAAPTAKVEGGAVGKAPTPALEARSLPSPTPATVVALPPLPSPVASLTPVAPGAPTTNTTNITNNHIIVVHGGTSPHPTPEKPLTPVAKPAPSPSPAPSPIPSLVPAVAPPAPKPVAGKDGSNGANGKDGCGIRIIKIETPAVAMQAKDYKASELPYLSTKLHPIPIKQIGSYSGKIGDYFYTKDTQILFKFPVLLPPRDAVHHITTAYIEMALSKLSSDGHPDTEWLCFLNEKICSGKVYEKSERTWQANINSKGFWNQLNGPFTDLFVSQLKGDEVGKMRGQTLSGSEAFSLQLADLIKNSAYASVADFLYDGMPYDQRADHDIRAVVADDTYVKSAKLVIEMEENTCKTNELDAAAASADGSINKGTGTR